MKRSALATVWFAFFLAIPPLLVPSVAQAEISGFADAINKSGRQRMLSQRILSAYYQIGKKISLTKSKKQLTDAVSLFESQLNELKTYAVSGEVLAQQSGHNIDVDSALRKVSRVWIPVKNIVTQEVMRSRAEELRELSEVLGTRVEAS